MFNKIATLVIDYFDENVFKVFDIVVFEDVKLFSGNYEFVKFSRLMFRESSLKFQRSMILQVVRSKTAWLAVLESRSVPLLKSP